MDVRKYLSAPAVPPHGIDGLASRLDYEEDNTNWLPSGSFMIA